MATRLDIALRVHTEAIRLPADAAESVAPSISSRPARVADRRPRRLLVLDSETTIDPTQRLTFGWYRYARVAWQGDRPTINAVEDGVFYAD